MVSIGSCWLVSSLLSASLKDCRNRSISSLSFCCSMVSPSWLIRCNLLTWLEKPKLPSVVDKGDVCGSNNKDHVRLIIAIDVLKRQCHRCQILSIAVKCWSLVQSCVSGVPAWKLNNYHVRSVIHGDKVGRVTWAIVVAYHCINLERARSAIMEVVLRD